MKKYLSIALALAVSFAAPAQAALIDFVAEAAGNERGVADGTTLTFNGVNITFSSGGAEGDFAYFDDLLGTRPAGLGVCGALLNGPGSECANPGDDNIQSGEAVTLTFDTAMTLSAHSFTDQNHNDLNGNDTNTLLIAINDPDDFQQFTFAEAVNLIVMGVELIRYAYDPSATGLAFYINSFEAVDEFAAPLPAAAPLLLFGMGGLAFAARKRRRA